MHAGCAHHAAEGEQPLIPPTPAGTLRWFDANPKAGYEASFFLYVPGTVQPGPNTPLLVMPNNTGEVSDKEGVHRHSALKQAFSHRDMASRLHAVLLVPAFVRPASQPDLYTHALDRDSLLVAHGPLKRIDLQLIAMIRQSQRVLGSSAPQQVLLFGFSAAGMFANRFALLHPEIVLAAAIGSPGGWPMAPTASFNSDRLRYPLGSVDLDEVAGSPMRLDLARKVRFFFFLGAHDTNDSVTYRDGYDPEDEALVMRAFGRTPVERWPVAQRLYQSSGLNATFKTYPDTGHEVTDSMEDDAIAFFQEALRSTRP